MNGSLTAGGSLYFTRIENKTQRNRVVMRNSMVPLNSTSLIFVDFILDQIVSAAVQERKIREGNYTSDNIKERMCLKTDGDDEYSLVGMMNYSIDQVIPAVDDLRQSIFTVTISELEESGSAPQMPNFNDFLMASASKIEYLPCSTLFQLPFLSKTILDKEDNKEGLLSIQAEDTQYQTKELLRVLLTQFNIGFTDSDEKKQLEKFVNSFSNVLCFIINNWSKLFIHKEFPILPANTKSKLDRMLTFLDVSNR